MRARRANLDPYGAPNRVSKRHKYQLTWMSNDGRRHTERCDRCGSHYHTNDGTGSRYCYPSAKWMAEHPEDDGGFY